MDMFRNSYVIFFVTLILSGIVVYMFSIGEQTDENGNVKFNWRYPLAFSLMVWVFCHFYLFPVSGEFEMEKDHAVENVMMGGMMQQRLAGIQKINLVNWN